MAIIKRVSGSDITSSEEERKNIRDIKAEKAKEIVIRERQEPLPEDESRNLRTLLNRIENSYKSKALATSISRVRVKYTISVTDNQLDARILKLLERYEKLGESLSELGEILSNSDKIVNYDKMKINELREIHNECIREAEEIIEILDREQERQKRKKEHNMPKLEIPELKRKEPKAPKIPTKPKTHTDPEEPKLQHVVKAITGFARDVKARFSGMTKKEIEIVAGSVLLAIGTAAQAATSLNYRNDVYNARTAFTDEYIPGTTAEQITEMFFESSDLRKVFIRMMKDENYYSNYKDMDEKYNSFKNGFVQALAVMDEYVTLDGMKNRNAGQTRQYHEDAIMIDDYQGYTNRYGETIGFNKTISKIIKAKLALAIEAQGYKVEDLDKCISIERTKSRNPEDPKEIELKLIVKNPEGKEETIRVTDSAWILFASHHFLNPEIASLADLFGKMDNQLDPDEKMEMLQVAAAIVGDEFKFNGKKLEIDEEAKAQKLENREAKKKQVAQYEQGKLQQSSETIETTLPSGVQIIDDDEER